MEKEDGFYESSGAGMVAQSALDLFVDNHHVIIMDAPEDVYVSRIRKGKYDGIPFPLSGSDDDYIHRTYHFLRSRTFRRWYVDIPVLWMDEMLLVEEQVRMVKEFSGL